MPAPSPSTNGSQSDCWAVAEFSLHNSLARPAAAVFSSSARLQRCIFCLAEGRAANEQTVLKRQRAVKRRLAYAGRGCGLGHRRARIHLLARAHTGPHKRSLASFGGFSDTFSVCARSPAPLARSLGDAQSLCEQPPPRLSLYHIPECLSSACCVLATTHGVLRAGGNQAARAW